MKICNYKNVIKCILNATNMLEFDKLFFGLFSASCNPLYRSIQKRNVKYLGPIRCCVYIRIWNMVTGRKNREENSYSCCYFTVQSPKLSNLQAGNLRRLHSDPRNTADIHHSILDALNTSICDSSPFTISLQQQPWERGILCSPETHWLVNLLPLSINYKFTFLLAFHWPSGASFHLPSPIQAETTLRGYPEVAAQAPK